MSIEASQIEAVLITLEREAMALRGRVGQMDAWGRMAALEQGIAASWALAGLRWATLSGQVVGCNSAAVSGATVAVKDHATGVTLGTGTTAADGSYSVAVQLASVPQNIDVVAAPAGTYAARFAGPVTQNVPSATQGDNAVPTIAFTAADGYVCASACTIPVPTTLTLSDGYGSWPFTYASGQWDTGWLDPGITGYVLNGDLCPLVGANCQYKATLSCSGSTWTLTFTFGAICYSGLGCIDTPPGTAKYKSGQDTTLSCSLTATATACAPLAIAFPAPGSVTWPACSGTASLPCPGGGSSGTIAPSVAE